MQRIAPALAAAAALGLATAPAAAAALAGSFSTTVTRSPIANLNGVWTVTFSAGGKYAITFNRVVVVRGTAAFRGSTITFGREHGPLACVGAFATGVYTWKLSGSKLRFTKVMDACPGRRQVLPHAFTKVG